MRHIFGPISKNECKHYVLQTYASINNRNFPLKTIFFKRNKCTSSFSGYRCINIHHDSAKDNLKKYVYNVEILYKKHKF